MAGDSTRAVPSKITDTGISPNHRRTKAAAARASAPPPRETTTDRPTPLWGAELVPAPPADAVPVALPAPAPPVCECTFVVGGPQIAVLMLDDAAAPPVPAPAVVVVLGVVVAGIELLTASLVLKTLWVRVSAAHVQQQPTYTTRWRYTLGSATSAPVRGGTQSMMR